MLMADGFTEQYIREQPIEWIEWANYHLGRRYRMRLVNEAVVHAQGTAASQSEEAADAFNEMVMNIRGEDDEDIAYLLDPNAKADTEALARSGLAARPPQPPPPQPEPDPRNPGYTIPPFEEDMNGV